MSPGIRINRSELIHSQRENVAGMQTTKTDGSEKVHSTWIGG